MAWVTATAMRVTTLSHTAGMRDDQTVPETRRERPTMNDVAATAGVALKTVSRVVNAEPGVNASTAERVRQAIELLGYRRNDGASVLRRGCTASIGLIIADTSPPELAAGIRAVFADRPTGPGLEVDTVLCDKAGGAASGVAHLIAHGHRRIVTRNPVRTAGRSPTTCGNSLRNTAAPAGNRGLRQARPAADQQGVSSNVR